MTTKDKKEKTTISDVLCEFFEISVHNILYSRKVYPETIFEPKRKYGVAVHQAVHPDVVNYINECVKAIDFHSKKKQVKKLFLCLQTRIKVLEKYVFDIVELSNIVENDPFLVQLEQCFRSFCLKLNTCHTYLSDLPDDDTLTFNIRILTTAYSRLEFNQNPKFEDFAWIDLNENIPAIVPEIVPLHTIKTDYLDLQIYVEREQNASMQF